MLADAKSDRPEPARPRLLRFWLCSADRGRNSVYLVRVEYVTCDNHVEQVLAILRESDPRHGYVTWLQGDYGEAPELINEHVADLALDVIEHGRSDGRFAGWDDSEAAAVAALDAAEAA